MKLGALQALALAGCLATCTHSPTETNDARGRDTLPDAAMRIEAKTLAVGVGYSWGKGTLDFQDKTYTVTMDGLLVVAVGLSSVTAKGGVYHLKTLEDFDGNYVAVRGGSTIGQGGAGVAMINQNGVEVRLVAENTGVTLTLGKSGVKLALEK
jgi:ABC-type amino acid transport substrate-binding protein